jgi:hypothetical protein
MGKKPLEKVKEKIELYRFNRSLKKEFSTASKQHHPMKLNFPLKTRIKEEKFSKELKIRLHPIKLPNKTENKPLKKLPKVYAIVGILLILVVALGVSYYNGYFHINLSSLTTSKAPSNSLTSLPPPPSTPKNNQNVVVNYLNLEENSSTHQYVYFSMSPSINSFNITPGSIENLNVYLSIPTGLSNAPSSVKVTNIVLNTSGFSVLSETPIPPIIISRNATIDLLLSIKAPSTPYYGELELIFELSPTYSYNTTT